MAKTQKKTQKKSKALTLKTIREVIMSEEYTDVRDFMNQKACFGWHWIESTGDPREEDDVNVFLEKMSRMLNKMSKEFHDDRLEIVQMNSNGYMFLLIDKNSFK